MLQPAGPAHGWAATGRVAGWELAAGPPFSSLTCGNVDVSADAAGWQRGPYHGTAALPQRL